MNKFVPAPHYPPIKSKLQHPPPLPYPGQLTIVCARGVGNLTFACLGWGQLNRKCQDLFSREPKSLTAIKHVYGRDRSVERKRYSICEILAYKKDLQKLPAKEFGLRNSSLSYYRVNTMWCVFTPSISLLKL